MARKRSVGEGTITHRRDGRWEVALTCRTTADTRKRIRKYARTRAEASEKLTELRWQMQQGVPVPDKTWRLGPYLDYWLEEVVRPNRRIATYEKDEQAVRLYLKPGLGTVPLVRLTVPRLQLFLNEQSTAGKTASTVHQIAKVLSAALTRAMKEELITRNVVRLVDLPSYTRREVVPWSMQEARDFLNAASDDPLLPAFALALLYGLRRGEVLGLRWQDVDLEANILRIRQQLQRRDGRLHVGPVKTTASSRNLVLRPIARTVLLARRSVQIDAQAVAGSAWAVVAPEEALVFTTSTGRPIEPRNFDRSFHRICAQHGIRRIRVHDLRHTVATFLSLLQVSPKDAQFTLGHSQVSTTIGIYQHASVESSERATAPIEAMLLDGYNSLNNSLWGGTPRSRQNVKSSRQNYPIFNKNSAQILAATSGAEDGTRTRDPRLTIAPRPRLGDRFTDVLRVSEARRCRWVLGLVAVNSSRQHSPTPLSAHTSDFVHLARTQSSARPQSSTRVMQEVR